MNQLDSVEKHLRSALGGGEILLIVPPFAIRDYLVIGPHILQVLARDMGFKTDILYANLLLASIMGGEDYDKISKIAFDLRWMKLGERLFARSAHGLPVLGKFSELTADANKCLGSEEQFVKVSSESEVFDLNRLLEIEELCASFADEISCVIASMGYGIVGCTTMLEQNNASFAILNGIKKLNPDIITLMGGYNCEGEMAEGIASVTESIDHIFSGESELSFQRFLKGYSRGEFPAERIVTGELLEDLNMLPLPDYNIYFKQMEQFFKDEPPDQLVISYETSRGCWRARKGKCLFCGGVSNHSYRQKSEDTVLEDLEEISKQYPVTNILMTDNIVPRSFYRKLFSALSEIEGIPPIWYQENTSAKLKDLVNLNKAQIKSLCIGIEALSTGLLNAMNKRTTARQNLIFLRNAHSVGIQYYWHLIWGLPGDRIVDYKHALQLFPLIRHLPPPREFLHLKLMRFSSYFENPGKYDIMNIRPLDIYYNIYPTWADINKLANEFMGDYPSEAHENIDVIRELMNEIATWRKSWKDSTLTLVPFADQYVIYDSRNIPETQGNHVIDSFMAKEIMRYCPYTGTQYQRWAVEQKLGVILDSWYTPLVTADAQLLMQFEEEAQDQKCK